MALKIRLRQQGRNNRQTFRLVVTDIRRPRDGKYLEVLGIYDPLRQENNFSLKADRLTYWLSQGAELSERAEALIKTSAPDLIKELHAKQHSKRVKLAAKRRQAKKKEAAPAAVKKAAAKAPAAKKTAAVAAEGSAAAKPARKAKPKKDEV